MAKILEETTLMFSVHAVSTDRDVRVVGMARAQATESRSSRMGVRLGLGPEQSAWAMQTMMSRDGENNFHSNGPG